LARLAREGNDKGETRSNVSFSVFDGDLKPGGDGACIDSLYTTAIHDFDPFERLAYERALFVSTAQSLGRKTLIWQADPNFNNDQHLADPRSGDAFPA
jgi:hypothetical protein